MFSIFFNGGSPRPVHQDAKIAVGDGGGHELALSCLWYERRWGWWGWWAGGSRVARKNTIPCSRENRYKVNVHAWEFKSQICVT